LDEPFGALDALTRHQIQELLTQIWEEHRLTVLFVTHDVEEAVYLSERIVVMWIGPGRITRTFSVDMERPRWEEIMESPALMDLLRGVHKAICAASKHSEMA
jgi:NitT/TauT family transport system ATP-binding protein